MLSAWFGDNLQPLVSKSIKDDRQAKEAITVVYGYPGAIPDYGKTEEPETR
jgi:hypothetical protein